MLNPTFFKSFHQHFQEMFENVLTFFWFNIFFSSSPPPLVDITRSVRWRRESTTAQTPASRLVAASHGCHNGAARDVTTAPGAEDAR
jgi:hypothetical protein